VSSDWRLRKFIACRDWGILPFFDTGISFISGWAIGGTIDLNGCDQKVDKYVVIERVLRFKAEESKINTNIKISERY